MIQITCHKCGHSWQYTGQKSTGYIRCKCGANIPPHPSHVVDLKLEEM